jgi:serine/threonine-protein kinase
MDPSSESLLLAQVRARVGTVLRSKWRLDALLGMGGMAAVYSATHRNGHRWAVKMLLPSLNERADIVRRFCKEGYVANEVNHPGAVTIVDDDVTEDGAHFLVMELLDGESLDRVLRRNAAGLAPAEVTRITHEVLDVLAAAHERAIVHRDIKPENLFVLQDGRVKLLDFGIARLRYAQTLSARTEHGGTMGTPAYMPPEQARGHWDEVDAQSDLWSLGATMFAALTGRGLRIAPTPNEELLLAMTEPAPPLHSVAPAVPLALSDIVDRALAFDKRSRWPGAREMQAALRAVQGADVSAAQVPARETLHVEPVPPAVGSNPPRAPTEALLASVIARPADAPPAASTGSTGPRGWRAAVAGIVVAGVVVAVALSVGVSRWRSSRASAAGVQTASASLPQAPETRATPTTADLVAPSVSSTPAADTRPRDGLPPSEPAEAGVAQAGPTPPNLRSVLVKSLPPVAAAAVPLSSSRAPAPLAAARPAVAPARATVAPPPPPAATFDPLNQRR